MATGDLVYIDGNQAAIIIGEGVGDDGSPDGSVIVGTFAGAQQIERGHYGDQPSVAGENPPSFTPEGGGAVVGDPGPVVVASAGGSDTPEATTDATQDSATQNAGEGGVLDIGTMPAAGEQSEAIAREQSQDERLAALERENAQLRARQASPDQRDTTTATDIGGQGDQGADLGGVPTSPGAPDAPTPSV